MIIRQVSAFSEGEKIEKRIFNCRFFFAPCLMLGVDAVSQRARAGDETTAEMCVEEKKSKSFRKDCAKMRAEKSLSAHTVLNATHRSV